MSTTIYLIRHGQSEANEKGLFLGHGDLNLTKHGAEQAQMTANYLKTQVGQPDVIYSSDLSRAYETGKCTAEQFDMPIIKDKELREIDAGQWEFVPFSELKEKFTESYGLWRQDIGLARCDGGESVKEVQHRIVCAITRIAKAHQCATVFIFTHATPIRVFAAHCLKKPLSDMKDLPWATNASVTKAVYDEDTFQLVEYGRDDFMGDCITALPSTV